MAHVKVENNADSSWQTTIEQRAYLLLSSLKASVPQVTVTFSELSANGVMPRRFRCTASSPSLSAGNYEISVEHPVGNEAIEGALQRFRRAVAHSRQVTRINNTQGKTMRRTG